MSVESKLGSASASPKSPDGNIRRRGKAKKPVFRDCLPTLMSKVIFTDAFIELPRGLSEDKIRNNFSKLSPRRKRLYRMRYEGEGMLIHDIAVKEGKRDRAIQDALFAINGILKDKRSSDKPRTARGCIQKTGEVLAEVIHTNKKRRLPNGLTIEQVRQNFQLLDEKLKIIFDIVCKDKQPIKIAASHPFICYSYENTQFLLVRAVRIILGQEKPIEKRVRKEKTKKPNPWREKIRAILTNEPIELPQGATREELMERYLHLNNQKRKVLKMHHVDDLISREIAGKLQLGIARIRAILHYSYKYLNSGDERYLSPNERIKKQLILLIDENSSPTQSLTRRWKKLPQEEKNLLIERFLHERSIEEIGDKMHYEKVSIRHRIKRDLKLLGIDIRGDRKKQEEESNRNHIDAIQIYP